MDVVVDIPFDGSGRCEPVITPPMPRNREEQRTPASHSDRVLRQLQIERTPLAYLLFDADLRLVDWNPAAQRSFRIQ